MGLIQLPAKLANYLHHQESRHDDIELEAIGRFHLMA
jgi:hypothetical protein